MTQMTITLKPGAFLPFRKASEHNCNNVTAALLEYKNRRFAGYDPMERFWLEDF